jgi:hypothetical protein
MSDVTNVPSRNAASDQQAGSQYIPGTSSPVEVARLMEAITDGLLGSLNQMRRYDHTLPQTLWLPARILFFFGQGLILASICLRIFPKIFQTLSFDDFIASLLVGCVLLIISVFLFCYQYHTEQSKTTAVAKATEQVSKGLVATLGQPKATPK